MTLFSPPSSFFPMDEYVFEAPPFLFFPVPACSTCLLRTSSLRRTGIEDMLLFPFSGAPVSSGKFSFRLPLAVQTDLVNVFLSGKGALFLFLKGTEGIFILFTLHPPRSCRSGPAARCAGRRNLFLLFLCRVAPPFPLFLLYFFLNQYQSPKSFFFRSGPSFDEEVPQSAPFPPASAMRASLSSPPFWL